MFCSLACVIAVPSFQSSLPPIYNFVVSPLFLLVVLAGRDLSSPCFYSRSASSQFNSRRLFQTLNKLQMYNTNFFGNLIQQLVKTILSAANVHFFPLGQTNLSFSLGQNSLSGLTFKNYKSSALLFKM